VLQGWLNIASVRDPSALQQVVSILREVAEWVPIAGKLAAVIGLL
jgi:hypothetical protein